MPGALAAGEPMVPAGVDRWGDVLVQASLRIFGVPDTVEVGFAIYRPATDTFAVIPEEWIARPFAAAGLTLDGRFALFLRHPEGGEAQLIGYDRWARRAVVLCAGSARGIPMAISTSGGVSAGPALLVTSTVAVGEGVRKEIFVLDLPGRPAFGNHTFAPGATRE